MQQLRLETFLEYIDSGLNHGITRTMELQKRIESGCRRLQQLYIYPNAPTMTLLRFVQIIDPQKQGYRLVKRKVNL